MRFIIYTPKGVKTGGPEALHQLSHALNYHGCNAFLLATLGTGRKEVVREFDIYNPTFIKPRELRNDDVLIVPEYLGSIPRHIYKRVGSLVLWWLSVDNSPLSSQIKRQDFINHAWSYVPEAEEAGEGVLSRKLHNLPKYIRYETKILIVQLIDKLVKLASLKIKMQNVFHIFQSSYAMEYVQKAFNCEGLMVTDYTRGHIDSPVPNPKGLRFDKNKFLVAYNPSKGLENIIALEKFLDKDISLIPIQGLTHNQLASLFDKVDLYLDLGKLPGKDRLPREAIFFRCPIVITTQGAGNNSIDFPVPEKFKLDLEKVAPQEAAKSLLKILSLGKSNNFKQQIKFFEFISREKHIFYEEVSVFLSHFSNS